MYQTIDYFCDNQKNKNGLFLLDMPTGLGKTYAVTEYLYKLAMDDVRAGQKVFFITTLKKNLPMEDLRNRFANDGQMARFEEKVLYIVSNADSVLGNWSDEIICAIPEGIKQTKEFRALEYDVQFIRCYDSDPNPDAKSSVAKVKENLCQNSEYQFRQYVSKLICNQFPNVQARLQAVHTDPAWQWLGKLYPAVFTRERQIIFLSMEKFLVHNTTIIEPNYVLCQSDLIRDAVIFIDEFDATKETLLKSIINNGIRNSVDCLELFRDIHAALQASKNAYALAKPWQYSWYSGYAEGYFRSLIADLKQRADALHNTFCLSLNCGTCADGTSANKYYLFQDHGHYLFLDGGQNTATMSDGDPGMDLDRDTNNVYEILNQMQAFLSFFQRCTYDFAWNYWATKQAQRKPNEDAVTWETAVRAVLVDFDLRWKHVDYLAAEILRGFQNCDSPFYESGFRYFILENDGTHNLPSKITVHTFRTTPEQIMLQLCEKAKVVGISATALADSVIGNYDIRYLNAKLGSHFSCGTAHDRARLRRQFARKTRGYENVSMHADFVSGLVDGAYSKKAWKQVFYNETVAQTIFDDLEKKHGSSYDKERYVRIALAYKAFIQHTDIRSYLCLLTKHPRIGDSTLDLKVLWDIFDAIARENAGALPIGFSARDSVVQLDSREYDHKKVELTQRLSRGEKLFVISVYQTLGAGQNIQYPVPQGQRNSLVQINDFSHWGEKDFDAIYLDKPTNLIVKLGDNLPEENFVKYLFQMKFLQQNEELSPEDVDQRIRRAVRCYATQQACNVRDSVVYQTKSVRNFISKMLTQAIGRLCRTNLKNPNIYLMADVRLADILAKEEESDRLLNPEFVALKAAAKGEPAQVAQARILEFAEIPVVGQMNALPSGLIGNNQPIGYTQTWNGFPGYTQRKYLATARRQSDQCSEKRLLCSPSCLSDVLSS